jgi:flagellar L-ring protein FlgH
MTIRRLHLQLTVTILTVLLPVDLLVAGKKKAPEPTPLDRYVAEALGTEDGTQAVTPGSLWNPNSRFADLAADLRARYVNDLVTILVIERASAIATGTTKSKRSSSANASVGALAGVTRAAGPLASLANLGSETQLSGEGTTSRSTLLTTTLAARVTHVLPNGYLVVEGVKDVQVNSERQLVTVRGVVRPADLTPDNVIRSDRLAQMEVRVNGKGVVGDAIRRPNILYRILLGILPF